MPKVAGVVTTEAYAPDAAMENAVHLVSQSKGGVGKSLVAKCIAEFVQETGRTGLYFDADPANQTLTRIQSLNVRTVQLLEQGDIKRRNFDRLLHEIVTNNGPFVVDTGSSSFYAIWDYIQKNEIFTLLEEEYDRPLIIHVPIAPEPDLQDTVDAFREICALVPDHSVVVWQNERTEPIRINGEVFAEWDVARENVKKLLGSVLIRFVSLEYQGADLVRMLKSGQTFSEAIYESETGAKDRLKRMRREIFTQLKAIGI